MLKKQNQNWNLTPKWKSKKSEVTRNSESKSESNWNLSEGKLKMNNESPFEKGSLN